MQMIALLLLLSLVISCFAKPIPIHNINFLGPFTVGKNELDGSPAYNIDTLYQTYRATKHKTTNLISELITGGFTKWKKIRLKQNTGNIQFNDIVDLNRIVQTLQSMEAQEVQGWVVAEVNIKKTGTYSINCGGIVTCYIDTLNRMIAGDLFRTNRVLTSIDLLKGKHVFYGKLKFKAQTQVTININFISRQQEIQIYPPSFLPDLVGYSKKHPDISQTPYYMGSGFLAIPVSNAGSNQQLIKFKINKENRKEISIKVISKFNIYPGQYTSIPIEIEMNNKINVIGIDSNKCPYTFSIIPYTSRVLFKPKDATDRILSKQKWKRHAPISIQLRCRTTRQSFVFTFQDHDGSISRAAAIAPLTNTKINTAGVLVSLHGTGVDVSRQADSYKYKPTASANDDNTPYTFGVKNMYTLAPTRNGAHNWEYTGFLSALKALEVLKNNNVIPFAIQQFLPSVNNGFGDVIWAGHSMGGHGAWHIATHVPDRALGVVSAAGWIRKEYYGDSNRFFVHDIGHSHIDASLKDILESCVIEHNSDLHVDNLKGMVVHARIGQNDRAVPPYQVKRMVRLLLEKGIETTYEELVGLEHWWWDTLVSNDGGVLNDVQMRKLFHKMETKRNSLKSCRLNAFTLVSMRAGSVESKCGVKILQSLVPGRAIKIHAKLIEANEMEEQVWQLNLHNVRRVTIYRERLCGKNINCWVALDQDQEIQLSGTTETKIDEYCLKRTVHSAESSDSITSEILSNGKNAAMAKANEQQWLKCGNHTRSLSLVTTESYPFEKYERGPTNSGPTRQVFASPFAIVTTAASSVSDLASYTALYMANIHMVAASTSVEIRLDTDLEYPYNNRNLIVVGRHNRLVKEYKEHHGKKDVRPPVEILNNGFKIGPCVFNESGTGILFLAPYWDDAMKVSRLRLYVMGNDDDGLKHISLLMEPTIPPMLRASFSNQVPDFVVVNGDVMKYGAGGILAAGYWNYDWSFSKEGSYWQC